MVIGSLLVVGVGTHLAATRIEADSSAAYPLAPTLRYHAARAYLLSPDAVFWGDATAETVPLQKTLRSGETLASILDELNLPGEEARQAVEVAAGLTNLRRLRSGDDYTVFFQGAQVAAIHIAVRDQGRLELVRSGQDWSGGFAPYDRRVSLRGVQGELDGLLDDAIRGAGGDAMLAYSMADVLQWDLDFNRDLRLGDRFEVLYERVFLDQRFHGVGDVLALAYESGGRRLTAYQYGDAGAYYDVEGRPLQKMFLRSPLRYSRVTSGFSNRRFHPVLKTYRPHYGVDYGAPAGTPVRATANGVVASAGWEKGGGRTVRLRHANGYLTAYLHLSGFAEGIRGGTRVRQSQTIGFVGSSGLATAAHLDYRVQLSGRWINPLSLHNEPAPPIPEEELAEFFAWRDALDASLREGAPRPEILVASGR
jgi:murein DD-endopeptidase MepM/ murein hydrolase activator NlpD